MAASSKPQGPRRVGQVIYLKPEHIDEYKRVHAAVWPEVLEQIKDSNVRDCRLRRRLWPIRSRTDVLGPHRLYFLDDGAPPNTVFFL